ncbi:MAG: cyclic peptide export ABC transporter [Clostridia bacterium]|nr:cyclic peptide export ABC transporter [Clostridia bacterium]
MRKYLRICISILVSIVLLSVTPIATFSEGINNKEVSYKTPSDGSGLLPLKIEEVESFIKKQMKAGKIPGLSVAIVKEGKPVYKKNFGYADLKEKRPVTSDTLFELGSTTKAFTALAVLDLKEKGLIQLDDNINKYIPWFSARYKGKEVNITLRQLLYHTSGIPYESIGNIPEGDGDNALEDTAATLVGKELHHYPGEEFLYATINYDVLGLIIQKVSGQSFENYVKTNVLKPLGLNHTYMSRRELPVQELSKGYKISFARPIEYSAPVYRGNTPAGYAISNIEDVCKWLGIQLGTDETSTFSKSIIKESHVADRTVYPGMKGSVYTAGWYFYQSGKGEYSHTGNNPNFSSFIAFRPGEKLGIAVLANMNTDYTRMAGQGIIDIIMGKKPVEQSDQYRSMDIICFAVICAAVPFLLTTIYLIILALVQIARKQRKFTNKGKKGIAGFFLSMLFVAAFVLSLYHLPRVMFDGLNWKFLSVWAPVSIPAAVLAILAGVLVFYLYFIITSFFPKVDEKSFFTLVFLSIASGFGNAFIIFIINEAIRRDDSLANGLPLYFLLGIVVYIYGQRLIRTRLISITNNMVFEKRIELISKVLKADYSKLEAVGDGKLHACLNNDTEMISGFANVVITGVTSFVTFICCFIYLGIISFYGLLLSILVIVITGGMYFAIGRSANKIWEHTRSIQNVFFKFINDLTSGFKELYLHDARRRDFKSDMEESCTSYRDKRIQGDMKFANVFVLGELMFTLVIGAVVFIFPVVFDNIYKTTLSSYVFVLLYMTGPFHGILNLIPNILQIRISWNRINEVIGEISLFEVDRQKIISEIPDRNVLSVELCGVKYSYKGSDDREFTVGPIDYRFCPGEVVFVAGGNGSGKSTLSKLITGLYTPDEGKILVNGKEIESRELGQYFSVVFSDFYLFDKLYGIDHKHVDSDIQKYLEILQLDKKVRIENGEFSTIKLSTGQKKRLALLISYLDDRPYYLFDEWAADQDPEFRKFFYQKLLPDMKDRGKCIIAITHDDLYFDTADKFIKMESGKIADSWVNSRAKNMEETEE